MYWVIRDTTSLSKALKHLRYEFFSIYMLLNRHFFQAICMSDLRLTLVRQYNVWIKCKFGETPYKIRRVAAILGAIKCRGSNCHYFTLVPLMSWIQALLAPIVAVWTPAAQLLETTYNILYLCLWPCKIFLFKLM